ncbi:hypothetical protein [Sanyastnella coralliicola]|uniref:hypothetical protein n=1 Tax=Sanyastnella coralliicola TaxID=3069118 RepID=UPI0027B9E354|nr:hypothetical protein [Longitalea sp. SCSIO 12813]
MTSLLLNIADSTNVAQGHKQITDQINVLAIIIGAIIILGLILIVRWIFLERAKKQQ